MQAANFHHHPHLPNSLLLPSTMFAKQSKNTKRKGHGPTLEEARLDQNKTAPTKSLLDHINMKKMINSFLLGLENSVQFIRLMSSKT